MIYITHVLARKCKTTTCLNNGTCVEYMGNYSCQCTKAFSGRRCQLDIDECQTKPCKYGGTCHNLVGSFQCSCLPGTTGQLCQNIINQCLSKPCQNGGLCINSINAFRCNCSNTGYTGRTCETRGMFTCVKSKSNYCLITKFYQCLFIM